MAKVVKKPGNYLYPLPPCLITCGPVEHPNIITLTWAGSLCSEPPIMGVSIRPSRHSHPLVKQSGEFAINLPTAEMLRAVDWCGNFSGRDHDKFAEKKLTAAPGLQVKAPIIGESLIAYECRTVMTNEVIPDRLDLAIRNSAYASGDFHRVYFGNILCVRVERELAKI